MYSVLDYGHMIADPVRMDAYAEALRQDSASRGRPVNIVVHDTVKLSGLADRQRLAVTEVQARLEDPAGLPGPVTELLDPRAHHPAHVALGVVLGVLFALAFGTAPR